MTRQLPKPVAVPLGRLIGATINGLIYTAGWALMRADDAHDAWQSRQAARRLWREADQYLRDGAK